MSIPFSAARARNAGFERVRELNPQVEYVQFIDGDCVLAPDWLPLAAGALRKDPTLAAVCGRLRERFPEASIYNRIAEIGWDAPTGEVLSCGGLFMVRASAFLEVGGFDPSVLAGEEPELCGRLRERGGRVLRLPELMASHDAAMFSFRQWWKRQLRAGRFDMDITRRFHTAPMERFRRDVHVARIWGVGLPLFTVAICWIVGSTLGLWAALIACLACLGVLPLQVLRVARRTYKGGYPLGVSLAYGALTVVSKWAHIVGQLWYIRDQFEGRGAVLIEYQKGRATGQPMGKHEGGASL